MDGISLATETSVAPGAQRRKVTRLSSNCSADLKTPHGAGVTGRAAAGGVGCASAGAAGKSTNIEFVPQLTKLGGNGPIMANALASMGLHVTYLGNLGYPNLHPVFAEFAQRAAVHSIAQPGFTDAIEFEDGKVMLGKHTYLKEVNWENITTRFGRDRFAAQFRSADLVGFVNWTMLTHMSDIWAAVLQEICPTLPAGAKKRTLFFDLQIRKNAPQRTSNAPWT